MEPSQTDARRVISLMIVLMLESGTILEDRLIPNMVGHARGWLSGQDI